MDRSFLLDSVRHISRHYELLGENIDMAERNGGDLRRLPYSWEINQLLKVFSIRQFSDYLCQAARNPG